LVWTLFAAIMGFALGGSFLWGVLYVPPRQYAANNQQAEGASAQKEYKNGFWEKASDDPVAYFTLWLVGFTGVLAVSTIGLWIVTWRASASQARGMKASIAASEKSADIARHAMIAGQRAFVFPVLLVPEWLIGDQPGHFNWQFRPMWRNSGDTPTKNMKMHSRYELRDTLLPDDFDFDYPTTDVGIALIPPKTEYAGGMAPAAPATITPSDIAAVQRGTKYMFFWGWAKYFDVFPETPARITRFCWQILPMGDPFAFRPGAPQTHQSLRFPYVYNRKGNCADDEC
jgi:hypothetical protein